MEENLQKPELETNTPPIQPEVKERNKYTWIIIAGVVVLLTLGLLTLGYSYTQKGSKPVDYTTTVNQEENSEEVVVEDENDLDTLLTELDSTSDTKQLEADYNQAVSESSGL